ncbi:MAG: GNAT family N-acetyltransferase [Polyangiales bacterium]
MRVVKSTPEAWAAEWDNAALTHAIDARLQADGMFEPLAHVAEQVHRFEDTDLVSLVEMRYGSVVDPATLTPKSRAKWQASAARGYIVSNPFLLGRRCYWLRDGEARIGTAAFRLLRGTMRPSIEVSSVYVMHAQRRRGWGTRLLHRVRDEAYAAGVEAVGLTTLWASQPDVCFYLRAGMWIRMWKHDLSFVFARDLPAWHVEHDGPVARFCVAGRVLITAHHEGVRLGWDTSPEFVDELGDVYWYAPGTFAVYLASRGWPLIRSDEEWRTQLKLGFSDCGGPEGLAFQIRGFEAYARRHGWSVTTPRIPGLDYGAR